MALHVMVAKFGRNLLWSCIEPKNDRRLATFSGGGIALTASTFCPLATPFCERVCPRYSMEG